MSIETAKSPFCIGIDLGTTNSSASVYLDGKSVTIPLSPRVSNPGGKSMPSVVRFEGGQRDQLTVGREAKDYLMIKPEEVFASVKTVMRSGDWERDPELVERFQLGGEPIAPVEIAAEILKRLIEEVMNQEQIDLQGEVQNVVICVPANTTDAYRTSVREAAVLAGLGERDDHGDILRGEGGNPRGISLLEEPTAAAIEYGRQLDFWTEEKEQTILVYDLGGGTFDVTILGADSTQAPPKFSVIATKGIAKLGGDDFDRALMEMCASKFAEASGIDIFDLRSDQAATSPKELKSAQQKLWGKAEEAKKNFAGGSSREEIVIPGLLRDGDGNSHDLNVEIKKADYVERIQPLLDAAQECLRDVLSEAKLELDDLNRIVLVGGSTKADWVSDSIMSMYPSGQERPPYVADDVDVIVSRGAALFGANHPNEDDVVTVDQVVSHNLGVELEGGVFGLVMPKLLQLDEENPVRTAVWSFGNPHQSDNIRITTWKTQKAIEFNEEDGKLRTQGRHYVSERDDLGQPLFEYVGTVTLEEIPKAPKGTLQVDVTMEIDKENMLTVSATCEGEEIKAVHSI